MRNVEITACAIVISFDSLSPYHYSLEAVRACGFLRSFYIFWKQKDRNGLGENPLMH